MAFPTLVREVLKDAHVIFDVGANRGKTVKDARHAYRKARIYAFEPVSATFDLMRNNLGKMRNVETFKLALSDAVGSGAMRAVPGGLYNHLLRPGEAAPEFVETVSITTGDAFCAEHGVDHIDYMKIDAEGNDLNVLRGFSEMFRERRVRFVQVEAGVNPDNRQHVRLSDFIEFFHEFSGGLVGLFDPVRRHPYKKMTQQGMFFCNALFAIEDLSERERRVSERKARLSEREANRRRKAAPAA